MVRFAHLISTIDTHAAGEPTRIVLSGVPRLPGPTMAAKKQYMAAHLDHFRTLLMQEPRGHRDMFGAIVTPPTIPQAQYGVLFMDGGGYLDMCGHGIISIATALIEIGMVSPSEPETVVVFDTAAGRVESRAQVEGQQVKDVAVANVASFLYDRDVELEVPEVGRIVLDVAFGGNFFAMVRADHLGLSVHPAHIAQLTRCGTMINQAVNAKLRVVHPTQPHITTVALTEIYEPPTRSTPHAKSAVIFGHGQLDRSPCGTGISATMATLYARGELSLGEVFISESLIGTRFRGQLLREVPLGDYVAVEPVFNGEAYITGMQQFVVDPDDPVKYGFTLGSPS
ncbi:MAG TPA: proline racemase family protein [Candidatus Entotheonella sp.]|jgi:proline racemase/trans-L-3-hydroxyproline dehydratase